MMFAALKLFGYSKREMIGANINSLIPEPISTVHQQYLTNYIRTGHEVWPLLPVALSHSAWGTGALCPGLPHSCHLCLCLRRWADAYIHTHCAGLCLSVCR